MLMNPNQIGAAPAQGNPQQMRPQGQLGIKNTLGADPQTIALIKKNPNVIKAVQELSGQPNINMDQVPEDALLHIFRAINQDGLQVAVAKIKKGMAQMKSHQGQGQTGGM